MSSRTPLDAERVRSRVGARWPRIDVVAETASTNADLVASADRRGDREVLVAERQTSGRGRLDRVWTSPPGAGLLFSVLVRPSAPVVQWGWVPLLTGVALAEAVAGVSGVACALKWPNDLLLGPQQRKAAGILVQTAGDAVVIGVGLNVSTTPDELPVPTATSLVIEGSEPDRADVLGAVLLSLDRWLRVFDEGGADLPAEYRRRCATLGTEVRVSRGDQPAIEGRAVDIGADGALVVRGGGGTVVVRAGDVEHVRAR